MTLPDLAPLAWAALVVGALTVGISKTALPGANTLGIALFAAVLPAKESTGAMLMLLVVGDALALLLYRRHADWRVLARLAPSVVAGLLVGVVFLALADDAGVRRVIGAILLALVALTLWNRRRASARGSTTRGSHIAAASYGSLGGFTTMVANAGGPVMSMYFLASRFSRQAFLGTAAWFFAVLNLAKLPFSIGLGLIDLSTLALDLLLLVPVLAGGAIGWFALRRMSQRIFDVLVTLLTIAGAVYLLL